MAGPDDRRDAALARALEGLKRARARIEALEATTGPSEPVSVSAIGIGLRLPGGIVDLAGLEAACVADALRVGTVPADRWVATGAEGAQVGGFLDDVYGFDAAAFRISPREARRMDPAQRLLLMAAREAHASAGVDPVPETAVYIATGLTDFAQATLRSSDPADRDAWSATGVLDSVQAGRIAYALDLSGPAIAVDTACSGGLVALHLALQDLRQGRCDRALVGAANVLLRPDASDAFAAMGALSPSGQCRPLSPHADGYVRSEGVVMLLLARTADAATQGLPELGRVVGTAVNQDGRSNGLTAPRGPAQTAVVQAAWRDAGIDRSTAALAGLHGTGTPLGDPVEVQALAAALGTSGPEVVVQASKARFGHAEPAAGLVALVDAWLALRRGSLPPLPGLSEVAPAIAAVEGRLVWPTQARSLDRAAPAGVSAFGLAGTNAHAVVRAARAEAPWPASPEVAWSLTAYRPQGHVDGHAYEVVWSPGAPQAAQAASVVQVDDVEALRRIVAEGTPTIAWLAADPHGPSPAMAACAGFARVAIAEGVPLGLLWDSTGAAPHGEVPVGEEWSWQEGWRRPQRVQATPGGREAPRPGRWWVIGGTGALGRCVVAHLAACPGVSVVVSARHDPGTDLPFVPLDLDDADAVSAAVASVGADLSGLVIVAGGSEDQPVASVPASAVASLTARLEHLASLVAQCPGADVRLVGSASEDLGVPGQAVYAAEMAGRAAIVEAAGGRAVRFGPFDRGMAEAVGAFLDARGVGRLPGEAVAGLWADPPVRGWLAIDGTRWAAAVPSARARAWLDLAEPGPRRSSPDVGDALGMARAAVAEALERSADTLPVDTGLADLGMDSMGAVLLARALADRLGRPVPPTLAYEHPTTAAIAAWIQGDGQPRGSDGSEAPGAARGVVPVITAFAGRFPGGAEGAEALWDHVVSGREAFGDAPADRYDVPALAAEAGQGAVRGGFLQHDVLAFDPEAHGLSPREAAAIDPAQRLLMDLTQDVLAQAGWSDPADRPSRVGVWIGLDDSEYGRRYDDAEGPDDRVAGQGHGPAFAAGRLAHRFGLTGPATVVETACSSSLVALAAAVDALEAGRCDAAIVGAAHLVLGPVGTRRLAAMRALSPSGTCHPFAADADGFVRGEGGGVLLIEREPDARARGAAIRARVRGVSVGHDGAAAGLTAPSPAAQASVIRGALARAGLAPDQVGWLEAHGTGTPLGDPLELTAVAAAHAERTTPLWVTATKRWIGHLEAAAGMASLAVVIEGLRRGVVPPFPVPRPNPDLPAAPCVFPDAAGTPPAWASGPRVAAISAFGMSGTNVHVVLEAGDAVAPLPRPVDRPKARPLGRPWLAPDRPRGLGALPDGSPAATPVVWVVPGDGAPPGGLGVVRRLPPASAVLDRVLAALPEGRRRPVIRALRGDARDADAASIARFVYAVGMGRTLRAVGAVPAAVTGLDEGAIAAAVLSGQWTVEDGVAVLRARRAACAALPRWTVLRAPSDQPAPPAGWRVRAVQGEGVALWTGPAEGASGIDGGRIVGHLPPAQTEVAEPLAESMAVAVGGLRAVASGHGVVPWLDPTTGQAADPRDPGVWRDAATAPVRLDRILADAHTIVELAARPVLRGEVRRQGTAFVVPDEAPGGVEAAIATLSSSSGRAIVWGRWIGDPTAVSDPVPVAAPDRRVLWVGLGVGLALGALLGALLVP